MLLAILATRGYQIDRYHDNHTPEPTMISKILDYLRGTKRPVATHVENLAQHPVVSLSPIATTQDALNLPVWFDHAPDSADPATYEGVFWEVEPTAEYLFYLAGDFQKNEKGLLRFRTAPVEIRAERTFEDDTIAVTRHDGTGEQIQAQQTAADVSDLTGLKLVDAVDALLPAAHALGHERWVIANHSTSTDIDAGISRLALGRHFVTDRPYAELIDERHYPAQTAEQRASLFRVTTWCDDPDVLISDLVAAQNAVAATYHDMPYVPLSGAIRL